MDEPGASGDTAPCISSARRLAHVLVLVLVLVLALALCLVVLADEGRASTEPPASGDWAIGASESVSHSARTLDVHGDLHIYGRLTLYLCDVWIWSEPTSAKGIVVHGGGTLDARSCGFGAGDPLLPYYIDAEPGSNFVLSSSAVTKAGASHAGSGDRSGVHVATASQLTDVLFQDGLVGLWVDGAIVEVANPSFVRCQIGVAVTGGGYCEMTGSAGLGIVECDIGALVDASTLKVTGGVFRACREGIVGYSSFVDLQGGCEFASTSLLGVGVYGCTLLANGTVLDQCLVDAMVVHTSIAWLSNLSFSGCTNDLRLVQSEAWLRDSHHTGTEDAAIHAYLSTVHIDGVSAVDSYWGLRAQRSSGECVDLTTLNTTFSVQATMCEGLRIERLNATGTIQRPDYSEDRGLYLQDSDVAVVNCTMTRMRNGLYIDGVRGLVEGVTVSDCTREGVIVRQSTLTMRDVEVTNATDGFLLSVYSRARLEGCIASYCRAAGFNITSGASDTLLRCNSSGCWVGMTVYLSTPSIIDCAVHQFDRYGHPLFMTYGIDCVEGAPSIVGGTVSGAGTGIRLAGSKAVVSGTTFRDISSHCVEVEESSGDEISRCTFIGQAGTIGISVNRSSPLIVGNTMRNLSYGVFVFDRSHPRLVGNLIEHIEWDGVLAILNCSVDLEGNTVRDCQSNALTVAFDARATSRGDVFELSGASNVLVQQGSSLDIEGSTMRWASIGLHGQGARALRVARCEFRDSNQGIRVEPLGELRGTDVRVEGCYFTNHASYCIGATASNLTVIDCTLLDNMAGIQVWNATSPVRVLDCSIVAAWLFGLMAEGSEVEWTVERSCRLVDADVTGHVAMGVLSGAKLEVVGSRIVIVGTGCDWFVNDGALLMRDVQMVAPGRCAFRALDSDVSLVECAFEGLGVPGTTSPGEMGMTIERSTLAVTNTTLKRADAGLALIESTATLANTTIVECSLYGVYSTGSDLALSNCTITRIATGTCLYAASSTVDAERTELSLSRSGLELHDVDARLGNSSIGGMAVAGIDVSGGTAVLVNTTHDPATARVQLGGVLEAWWYVSVRVVWANATELPAAIVTVVDGSGRTVARGSPREDGRVGATLLLAYSRTAGGLSLKGPHTVSAQLHGFNASRTLELTSSVDVELRLLDETAPTFELVSPPAPETWSRSGTVEVFGRAVDAGSGTRTVEARLDYGPSPVVSQGASFTFTFKVTSGQHVVSLRCVDWAGNAANATLVVNVETTPLALAIGSPADASSSNATAVEVAGLVSRAGATVRVNGALATVEGDLFRHELAVHEGANAIRVEATDAYGHRAEGNVTLWVDRTPPGLSVASSRLVNTTLGWVAVRGNVSADAELTINSVPVLVRDGAFDVSFPVGMGESFVVVRATDAVGNAAEVRILVDRLPEEEPPQGPDWWSAVPFAILLPLLMAAEWYAIVRPDRGEEGA